MQVRNDYERDVFNGDVGVIAAARRDDDDEPIVEVDFDGRRVRYEADALGELELAYAVSVHKSQGSEYPAVVIPLLMQHYMLLQRNLLYTAVTRGKRLVVLVGSERAIRRAVGEAEAAGRHTGLRARLVGDKMRHDEARVADGARLVAAGCGDGSGNVDAGAPIDSASPTSARRHDGVPALRGAFTMSRLLDARHVDGAAQVQRTRAADADDSCRSARASTRSSGRCPAAIAVDVEGDRAVGDVRDAGRLSGHARRRRQRRHHDRDRAPSSCPPA